MPRQLQLTRDDRTWLASAAGGKIVLASGEVFAVSERSDGTFVVEAPDGSRRTAVAIASADVVWVGLDEHVLDFRVERSVGGRGAARDQDALSSPMPATVVRIAVKAGDAVNKGDALIVLEAMKMELPIRAPRAAVVKAVNCREGELVQPGHALVELDG